MVEQNTKRNDVWQAIERYRVSHNLTTAVHEAQRIGVLTDDDLETIIQPIQRRNFAYWEAMVGIADAVAGPRDEGVEDGGS